MSNEAPKSQRNEDLTAMIESILKAFGDYVNKYKGEVPIEVLLKQDLRYAQSEIDNMLLSWIIQQEYAKMRSEELRLVTEIGEMQKQDEEYKRAQEEKAAAEKAQQAAKPVTKAWSIDDEE